MNKIFSKNWISNTDKILNWSNGLIIILLVMIEIYFKLLNPNYNGRFSSAMLNPNWLFFQIGTLLSSLLLILGEFGLKPIAKNVIQDRYKRIPRLSYKTMIRFSTSFTLMSIWGLMMCFDLSESWIVFRGIILITLVLNILATLAWTIFQDIKLNKLLIDDNGDV